MNASPMMLELDIFFCSRGKQTAPWSKRQQLFTSDQTPQLNQADLWDQDSIWNEEVSNFPFGGKVCVLETLREILVSRQTY